MSYKCYETMPIGQNPYFSWEALVWVADKTGMTGVGLLYREGKKDESE